VSSCIYIYIATNTLLRFLPNNVSDFRFLTSLLLVTHSCRAHPVLRARVLSDRIRTSRYECFIGLMFFSFVLGADTLYFSTLVADGTRDVRVINTRPDIRLFRRVNRAESYESDKRSPHDTYPIRILDASGRRAFSFVSNTINVRPFRAFHAFTTVYAKYIKRVGGRPMSCSLVSIPQLS